jgi:hypothetical protein
MNDERRTSVPSNRVAQTASGSTALAFGVLAFFVLPVVGGVLALVFGYRSRREAAADADRADDLGRVGRILGWTNVVVYGGLVLLALSSAILSVSGGGSSSSTCAETLEAMGGRDEVQLFSCSDGETEINIDRVPDAQAPEVRPVPTGG